MRALFDNHWLHLFQVDDAGRLAWRYAGNLEWVPFDVAVAAKEQVTWLAAVG